jgi:2-polyprenyl-3-methyl-5-hydroxy-6-metoxy-1,4-benzoquinol methylase
MGASGAWHEDDAFWAAMHPVFFTDQHWQDARSQTASIVRLLDLHANASILDLACGPGRHAIEFARAGYVVTAVDRTAVYLEEASSRASELGLAIECVLADMREVEYRERFDAVVSLSTSFGYFEDPGDDLRVLRNIHASLAPGGAMLIETMGVETVARTFAPSGTYTLADGTRVDEVRSLLEGGTRFSKTRTVTKPGTDPVSFAVSHRLFTADGMRSLLHACGCADVDIFGSVAGSAYDDAAEMLVAVARKRGAC